MSSNLITNTTYPLIANSDQYMIVQKVVSIHSEDRNITKYPISSDFEIELPEDMNNVSTVQLGSYTFPANYDTFSLAQGNITMVFQMFTVYNPADYGYFNEIQDAIFRALSNNLDREYVIIITEGFYSPDQMSSELTNRFNDVITKAVYTFLLDNDEKILAEKFINTGGYGEFVIEYNPVTQSLWFGNKSSQFEIVNNSKVFQLKEQFQALGQCSNGQVLPDFSNSGLPAYLGFTRCPETAQPNPVPGDYPRFFFANSSLGQNGFWLTPSQGYKNNIVYYLEAPFKINLMGNAYFYMQIEGLNNIDETNPYSFDTFTNTTNMTNGRVNSAFAKIAVTTTPISQWFDSNSEAVKIFNPPAERIRRIRIKLRYHDGSPVLFDRFSFSFNLLFNLLLPQPLRSFMTYNPASAALGGQSSTITKRG